MHELCKQELQLQWKCERADLPVVFSSIALKMTPFYKASHNTEAKIQSDHILKCPLSAWLPLSVVWSTTSHVFSVARSVKISFHNIKGRDRKCDTKWKWTLRFLRQIVFLSAHISLVWDRHVKGQQWPYPGNGFGINVSSIYILHRKPHKKLSNL